MTHEIKICPECREEFTLAANECSDCGIPLVFPDEAPEETQRDFPPVSELECVRVGPLPWTRALSDHLTQHEISHRVERDTRSEEEGGAPRHAFDGAEVYGTWVRPEELAAAREIDADLFRLFEPEREEDADDDELCPACQEPLAPDAVECAECGLSFG